jgi:hypothetical protein
MTEEKTFTAQEVQAMLERQRLVYALDHAIARGKREGDSPEFVNPLVGLYNQITAPTASPEPKQELIDSE